MSQSSQRVLIHGAFGRMGRTLMRLYQESPGSLNVVAAVIEETPAQRAIDGVPYFSSEELNGVPKFDVAIDFSLPQGFDSILALCAKRGSALVSGTTGLSETQRAAIAEAGKTIPVLWASNYSLGVAVLNELVERAAQVLQGWDCDIVESHHIHKKDAPSGTALSLGEAAENGGAHPRYASLRAGDIVGDHLVQFTSLGERIELIHRAASRDVFARGALQMAARLAGKYPGVYRIRDLV
ncbi:MAG: 4-hydroxy-tetrahydrodipicolinate reductase [Xanthomonadaceae bacterium]|jgi:4-hydroxy-tetrahydrodipicolinate reductase|nr:4-hydroxy-tetrahydrodipicolinate reductase [Xanthomonadaceae bacterium]